MSYEVLIITFYANRRIVLHGLTEYSSSFTLRESEIAKVLSHILFKVTSKTEFNEKLSSDNYNCWRRFTSAVWESEDRFTT
jgi:hypothetical protein